MFQCLLSPWNQESQLPLTIWLSPDHRQKLRGPQSENFCGRHYWLRGSFHTEDEVCDIYYCNSTSVPNHSFYFFDRVYIYVNYNRLLSNKEASSENPLTFSWNSRIPNPNQLWVRDCLLWSDISWHQLKTWSIISEVKVPKIIVLFPKVWIYSQFFFDRFYKQD